MSLSDSGFEPGGKRNFLQLTDKDGEQPQVALVSGKGITKQVHNFLNNTKNTFFLLEIDFGFETKYILLKDFLLYFTVSRMSQEQQIAVDWMTVPRSGSLGPCQGTVLQAAVATTAVHLTPTHPSSTNLRLVGFAQFLNM